MFYAKKIKYLDYYEGGEKAGSGGFVKLEVREGILRMEMNIRGLHPTDSFERDVILLGTEKEETFGQVCIRNGCGEFRYSGTADKKIGAAGISYEELRGIRIPIGGTREILCEWENGSASKGKKTQERKAEEPEKQRENSSAAGALGTETDKETPPAEIKVEGAEEDSPAESAGEASGKPLEKPAEEDRTIRGEEENSTAGNEPAGITAENTMVGTGANEEKEAGSREAEEGGVGQQEVEAKAVERKQAEAREVELQETETKEVERKQAKTGEDELRETETKEVERQQAAAKQAEQKETDAERVGQQEGEGKEAERKSAQASKVELQETEVKAAGASESEAKAFGSMEPEAKPAELRQAQLEGTESNVNTRAERENMEKQGGKEPAVKLLEDKWQQLSAIYPHIQPFHDERDYLSLTPADFVLFPTKFYRAVNNSFLLHGYYNYHHLILARVERKGEMIYYIGVPGNYFEREKQVAMMFGFESFECETEPAKTGDFGYYLMRTQL